VLSRETQAVRTALSALLAAALAAALAVPASAEPRSSVDAETLAEAKRTALGLYLTAGDAHRALEADPGLVFLDVRDPQEATFVGHPISIDALVPVLIATHDYSAEKRGYAMRSNPAFVAQVDAVMAREGRGRDDDVIVMCRSGGRGAMAARALIEAGYTRVWNLVGGFEGDRGPDGARDVNGWLNAGLPWTNALAPEAAWTPAE
jgi:rhodanese-related sulfurtransferase